MSSRENGFDQFRPVEVRDNDVAWVLRTPIGWVLLYILWDDEHSIYIPDSQHLMKWKFLDEDEDGEE